MFLVHVPTGLAVGLGKRMGWGWYTANAETIGPQIQLLYDTLERDYAYGGEQDNFALAMEDTSGEALAMGAWEYSSEKRADGLRQLVMKTPNAALSGERSESD
jgi:hypothetical protein